MGFVHVVRSRTEKTTNRRVLSYTKRTCEPSTFSFNSNINKNPSNRYRRLFPQCIGAACFCCHNAWCYITSALRSNYRIRVKLLRTSGQFSLVRCEINIFVVFSAVVACTIMNYELHQIRRFCKYNSGIFGFLLYVTEYGE